MWEQLQEWDTRLFVFLNNLQLGEYDAFWIFVTRIEHWIPLYLFFFFLFFRAYAKKEALLGTLYTLLTCTVTLALTDIIKNGIARLRPNNTPELAELIRVLQTPTNFSFFSGHAAVSMAVTTFVVLALRRKHKWIYVFYLWPLLFMASRIFVGVHFPGDILVGAAVGTTIAIIIYRIFKIRVLKL